MNVPGFYHGRIAGDYIYTYQKDEDCRAGISISRAEWEMGAHPSMDLPGIPVEELNI